MPSGSVAEFSTPCPRSRVPRTWRGGARGGELRLIAQEYVVVPSLWRFSQQFAQCTFGDEKCPVPSTDSRYRTSSHSNPASAPPRYARANSRLDGWRG